jgi:hypothetical protein
MTCGGSTRRLDSLQDGVRFVGFISYVRWRPRIVVSRTSRSTIRVLCLSGIAHDTARKEVWRSPGGSSGIPAERSVDAGPWRKNLITPRMDQSVGSAVNDQNLLLSMLNNTSPPFLFLLASPLFRVQVDLYSFLELLFLVWARGGWVTIANRMVGGNGNEIRSV